MYTSSIFEFDLGRKHVGHKGFQEMSYFSDGYFTPNLDILRKYDLNPKDLILIAPSCIILPGVRIGKLTVVGTSAVVTKDVPPKTVVAVVPARVIKHLDE